MRLMKEDSVQLGIFPVCECGYIFRDGVVIYKDIRKVNNVRCPEHFFQPWKCPNCHKIIDCVKYNDNIIEVKELRE